MVYRGILLTTLVLLAGNARAQSFTDRGMFLSAGYGLPDAGKTSLNSLSDMPGFSRKGYGPLHLKWEKTDVNDWGFGAGLNFSQFSGSWQDSGYAASLKGTAFSLLFRANKYLVQKKKMQFYVGAGLGYRSRITSYKSDRPGATQSQEVQTLTARAMPLGFEFTAGGRLALSPRIGLYLEGGLAKSLIQGGLVFRL